MLGICCERSDLLAWPVSQTRMEKKKSFQCAFGGAAGARTPSKAASKSDDLSIVVEAYVVLLERPNLATVSLSLSMSIF